MKPSCPHFIEHEVDYNLKEFFKMCHFSTGNSHRIWSNSASYLKMLLLSLELETKKILANLLPEYEN